MPIQIIPAPQQIDPMQQLGSLWDMYTQMQLQPLKMQAMQGQLAQQQASIAESQAGIRRADQQAAASQQTQSYEKQAKDLENEIRRTRTEELIARYQDTLTPQQLAFVAAGGNPNDLQGPAGLAYHTSEIEADPLRKAQVQQVRASTAAASDSAANSRSERRIREEGAARLKAALESAGNAFVAPEGMPLDQEANVRAVIKTGGLAYLSPDVASQIDPKARKELDIATSQLETAKLNRELAQDTLTGTREDRAFTKQERERAATGRNAAAQAFDLSMAGSNVPDPIRVAAHAAIASGVPYDSLPPQVRNAVSDPVLVLQVKNEQDRQAEIKASNERAQLELEKSRLGLEAVKAGKLPPERQAEYMLDLQRILATYDQKRIQALEDGRIAAIKVADDPLVDEKGRKSRIAAINLAAQKSAGDWESAGREFATNNLKPLLGETANTLMLMGKPLVEPPPDPTKVADVAPPPPPKIPGLADSQASKLAEMSLTDFVSIADQLIPEGTIAPTDKQRSDIWRAFQARGIPLDPSQLDSWLREYAADKVAGSGGEMTRGGIGVVRFDPATVGRLRALQKLARPPASLSGSSGTIGR